MRHIPSALVPGVIPWILSSSFGKFWHSNRSAVVTRRNSCLEPENAASLSGTPSVWFWSSQSDVAPYIATAPDHHIRLEIWRALSVRVATTSLCLSEWSCVPTSTHISSPLRSIIFTNSSASVRHLKLLALTQFFCCCLLTFVISFTFILSPTSEWEVFLCLEQTPITHWPLDACCCASRMDDRR